MSKTNHRVYKDREERLQESNAHKSRRGFKYQIDELIDAYEPEKDIDDVYEDIFGEDECERFQKMRRKS